MQTDSLLAQKKMEMWSNTDWPYHCLLDVKRTNAFHAAIQAVVEPGDIVIDAGSGSGILAFFAARAGAKRVYAIEANQYLATCLSRSIHANSFENVIQVVQSDIHSATLPGRIDVFICEMMETGLMDEMQVTAINTLRKKNTITPDTRMIPRRYETFIELGFTDFSYYGYKIFTPKHDWLHFESDKGWLPTSFTPHTSACRIGSVDFQETVQSLVSGSFVATVERDGVVNAVRLSARAHLTESLVLGATNALNGDKVLPIDEIRVIDGQDIELSVSYEMGGGLASLQVKLQHK